MSELRWYLLLIGAVILGWIWYSGRRQSKAARHDVFRNVEAHQDDVLMKDDAGNPVEFNEEKPAKSFEEALAEVEAMGADESPAGEPELPGEAAAAVIDDDRPEPRLPGDDEVIVERVAAEAEDDTPAPSDAGSAAEGAGASVADEIDDADDPIELIMLYVVAPEDKPFPGRAVLKSFHVHKLRFGDLDIFHRETVGSEGRQVVFSISDMLKPGTLVPDEVETREIRGLGIFMQLPSVIDPVDAFNDMLHTAQHLASALGGELHDETLQPLTQDTIASLRVRLVAAGG